MDNHIVTALFLFVLVMVITPGPNNIMPLSSGLNFGIKRTIPHAFGIILGVPIMTTAVGFGLGKLFTTISWLQQIIKITGISYLLFLAWKIAITDSQYHSSSSRPLSLLQAAEWVNPKDWVIIIGAVGTYSNNNTSSETWLIVTAFF